MIQTVKELEVGKEYLFIEANPDKDKDLNIVRATLKDNKESHRGYFPEFIEKKTQGEIFFMLGPDEGDKPLNSILILHVNSNYDKPEVKEPLEELFGTWANPKGYIICDPDNVNHTLVEFHNFLLESLNKYQQRVNEAFADLSRKKDNYKKQIEWLEKNL